MVFARFASITVSPALKTIPQALQYANLRGEYPDAHSVADMLGEFVLAHASELNDMKV